MTNPNRGGRGGFVNGRGGPPPNHHAPVEPLVTGSYPPTQPVVNGVHAPAPGRGGFRGGPGRGGVIPGFRGRGGFPPNFERGRGRGGFRGRGRGSFAAPLPT